MGSKNGLYTTDFLQWIRNSFGRPRPRWIASAAAPSGLEHKISVEVIAFVDELKATKPDLTLPQVISAIAARFGLDVHRRSLERALTRKKKRLGSP